MMNAIVNTPSYPSYNGHSDVYITQSPRKSPSILRLETRNDTKKVDDLKSCLKAGPSESKNTKKKTVTLSKAQLKRSFTNPAKTKRNHDAAKQIQRAMRGWWQRVQFRVALLQHKLDTAEDRTKEEISQVHECIQCRKKKFDEKIKKQKQAELKKVTMVESTATEGQKLIFSLRKENKKLREKNTKIYKATHSLKAANTAFEAANSTTGDSHSALKEQAKTIEETHEKLKEVVPAYEANVEKYKAALQAHRTFGNTEHQIKLLYIQTVGTIVEMMEDRCRDTNLTEEIVEYCLAVEEHDKAALMPILLEDHFATEEKNDDGSVSSEDSENYEEYTVATMD